MELTVFILLGVIVLVALLTRRVAARARNARANVSQMSGSPPSTPPAIDARR